MSSSRRFNFSVAMVLATLLSAANSLLAETAAAQTGGRPETPVLDKSEYRTSLDQVIVTGRAREEAPRWDKPKVEIPEQTTPERLQFLPKYEREERDDTARKDPQNPQPRIKLFEMKF